MDPPWCGSGASAGWLWASGGPLSPVPRPANAALLGSGAATLLPASLHFRGWSLTVRTLRTSPKCEFLVIFLLPSLLAPRAGADQADPSWA